MNKQKLMIAIVLVLSFIITKVMSQTVFIADTPQLNKNLPSMLASLFQKTPQLTPQQNVIVNRMKSLPVAALQPVAQGIYAKEDSQSNIIYVRITQNTNLQGEQTITVNGKTIKIYVPSSTP